MMAILSKLNPFGSSGQDEQYNGTAVGGVEAVVAALSEQASGRGPTYMSLGEPQLVDRGALNTEYHVVVPTTTYGHDVPEPANLDFPAPDDPTDPDAQLNVFLDALGLSGYEEIDQVEGSDVEVMIENGVPVPMLDFEFTPTDYIVTSEEDGYDVETLDE